MILSHQLLEHLFNSVFQSVIEVALRWVELAIDYFNHPGRELDELLPVEGVGLCPAEHDGLEDHLQPFHREPRALACSDGFVNLLFEGIDVVQGFDAEEFE